MFDLTSPNTNVVVWGKTIVTVDTSFNNVIRVYEVFKDESLTIAERYEEAAHMLFKNIEELDRLNYGEHAKLLTYVLETRCGYANDEEQNTNEQVEETAGGGDLLPLPAFCFKADATKIYASFMMCYGIDLKKEYGKLEYNDFMALLENLDEKTPFKNAVYYRTCELPKRKDNEDEYKRVKKLKKMYKLDTPETRRIEAHNLEIKMQQFFKKV